MNDVAKFAEIHEYGYDIFNAPRRGRGGGVSFIFNPTRVRLVRNNVSKYSSFEVLEALLQTSSDLLRLCVVSRSTQSSTKQKYQETKKALFFEEFSDYLDVLSSKSGRPVICSDFNFHLEDDSDTSVQKFVSIYQSKGFTQHIEDVTHVSSPQDMESLQDAVYAYDSILTHLLDIHAPMISIDFKPKRSPWWNYKCQSARHERRKHERMYENHRDSTSRQKMC